MMNIFRISLIAVLLSVFIAFFFTRSISKPINELKQVSKRIASGDLDARVFLKGNDELKELGDSFNYMSEKTKESFGELTRQKSELDNIISSIPEGLVVLDGRGRVILTNEVFTEIADSRNNKGKFYWEVLRAPEFNDFIKRTIDRKKSLSEEITLDNRVYLCNSAFIGSQDELILVFHDVTDMRRLEKIKKDFVTNVSHELRTPLTAIKGFAETLEEDVSGENRKHASVIKRHTDRLISIVADLLLLSRLEEKTREMNIEKVNIRQLMDNISVLFAQKLKDKNLEMRIDVDKGAGSIDADAFKLEQMLINLIDNSLKYTEKGGITVTVCRKEGSVVFEVKDSGIGIPEELLPRVFERFFVVDKSRSRQLGGTGLGLSIVKHIVQLHKGTIDVKSKSGTGTSFSIILPLNLS